MDLGPLSLFMIQVVVWGWYYLHVFYAGDATPELFPRPSSLQVYCWTWAKDVTRRQPNARLTKRTERDVFVVGHGSFLDWLDSPFVVGNDMVEWRDERGQHHHV